MGLVEIIPRRGSFVKRISRHDIEENFPIRAALEGLAAKLAAEKISDETLALMEETLAKMGRAVTAKNINSYYSNHLRFHELFIDNAHNELLKTTLTNLRMQSLWHRFSYQYYQQDLEKSYRVHQEIMKCFQAGRRTRSASENWWSATSMWRLILFFIIWKHLNVMRVGDTHVDIIICRYKPLTIRENLDVSQFHQENHRYPVYSAPFQDTWLAVHYLLGHRISGVLLAIYVCFHIITLSALQDPVLFENKMKMFASLFPAFFEWLLAVPVIYHSLNGGRLLLYELFGNRRDQLVLGWVCILSVSYIVLLGFFMAIGNQSVSAILSWVYMIVVSLFITFVTVKKIKQSHASVAWKLQRISGAFLFFVMIPAHMLYMHLDPSSGRDAQVIISRMSSSFIKLVDFVLVCSVIYHGAYGLLGISRDYLSSRGSLQVISTFSITILMAVFAWLGVNVIFSVG